MLPIVNIGLDLLAQPLSALQNYRSTATILDSANSIISKNTGRKSKHLWTAGEKGKLVKAYLGYDEMREAHFVGERIETAIRDGRKFSEIAVFYRTNAQSRALEEELIQRGVPYRIYGNLKFYERKEIKD